MKLVLLKWKIFLTFLYIDYNFDIISVFNIINIFYNILRYNYLSYNKNCNLAIKNFDKLES